MNSETCSWIDSHCHPHFPQIGGDLTAVRETMKQNNVCAALAVATGGDEWQTVRRLTQDFPGEFYAACGVHPLSDENEADDEQTLMRECSHAEVLAVGETGLDFFRGENEAAQRKRFAAHIAVARRLNKPLIIHTRDSHAAVMDMLRSENAKDVGGVLHCFTGTAEQARDALDINFVVSFSGILTFKKSKEMRKVIAALPADSYMVETDAPYLSPAPHRGKTNTPGYVRHVGEAAAAARGSSLSQTAKETCETFVRIFNPPDAKSQIQSEANP